MSVLPYHVFVGILTVLLFYYILFKLNALMAFYWPVIAFLAYTTEAHKKKQLVIKFNDSQSILVIMMAMITAKWQWNDTEINKCKKNVKKVYRQLSDERSCFWECKWNYFKLLKIPIGVNENAISNANDTYAAALFFNQTNALNEQAIWVGILFFMYFIDLNTKKCCIYVQRLWNIEFF